MSIFTAFTSGSSGGALVTAGGRSALRVRPFSVDWEKPPCRLAACYGVAKRYAGRGASPSVGSGFGLRTLASRRRRLVSPQAPFSCPTKEILHLPVTQDPSYGYVSNKKSFSCALFLLLSAWCSIGDERSCWLATVIHRSFIPSSAL